MQSNENFFKWVKITDVFTEIKIFSCRLRVVSILISKYQISISIPTGAWSECIACGRIYARVKFDFNGWVTKL